MKKLIQNYKQFMLLAALFGATEKIAASQYTYTDDPTTGGEERGVIAAAYSSRSPVSDTDQLPLPRENTRPTRIYAPKQDIEEKDIERSCNEFDAIRVPYKEAPRPHLFRAAGVLAFLGGAASTAYGTSEIRRQNDISVAQKFAVGGVIACGVGYLMALGAQMNLDKRRQKKEIDYLLRLGNRYVGYQSYINLLYTENQKDKALALLARRLFKSYPEIQNNISTASVSAQLKALERKNKEN